MVPTRLATLVGATLLLLSAPAWPGPPWLGVEIEKSPTGGVHISGILPESPLLHGKGTVTPGEVLLAVEGHPVQNPNELIALMRTLQVGQRVKLSLRNAQGAPHDVWVTLSERVAPEVLQTKTLLGKPAPDFAVHTVSGPELPPAATSALLAGLHGTPVLLDFFATWCGPCMYAVPRLSALQQHYPGLRVIGVSDESPELLQGMVGRYQPAYTIAQDPNHKAGRAYRVFSYPTLVLVDRSGVVRTVSNGDLGKVEEAVAQLLSEPARVH